MFYLLDKEEDRKKKEKELVKKRLQEETERSAKFMRAFFQAKPSILFFSFNVTFNWKNTLHVIFKSNFENWTSDLNFYKCHYCNFLAFTLSQFFVHNMWVMVDENTSPGSVLDTISWSESTCSKKDPSFSTSRKFTYFFSELLNLIRYFRTFGQQVLT